MGISYWNWSFCLHVGMFGQKILISDITSESVTANHPSNWISALLFCRCCISESIHISWTQESWPRNRTLCCCSYCCQTLRLKPYILSCLCRSVTDVILEYYFNIVASCFLIMSLSTRLIQPHWQDWRNIICVIKHLWNSNVYATCVYVKFCPVFSAFSSVIPSSIGIFFSTCSLALLIR